MDTCLSNSEKINKNTQARKEKKKGDREIVQIQIAVHLPFCTPLVRDIIVAMASKPLYTYLEPELLADRIAAQQRADVSAKKFIVLDVRDDDEWEGGRISTACHLPTELWTERTFVHETMHRYMELDEVIIHCYKSQQRGPSCARLLAIAYEQFAEQQESHAASSSTASAEVRVPEVRVLRGGFCDFERKYQHDSTLVHR